MLLRLSKGQLCALSEWTNAFVALGPSVPQQPCHQRTAGCRLRLAATACLQNRLLPRCGIPTGKPSYNVANMFN